MLLERMLDFIRERINPQNPLLLFYHKVTAFLTTLFYGFPARKMKVIAVTGTSGKTTTCSLIASILDEHFGRPVGVLSSFLIRTGKRTEENITKITTFPRTRLNRFLKEMKQSGITTCVMEVTSHALAQNRLAGIPVDTSVLTNLTGDHLEYHGGLAEYIIAKKKLFRGQRAAVLPKDDIHFSEFEALEAQTKISFGTAESARIHASDIAYRPDGTSLTLHYGDETTPINFQLAGKPNTLNALAAAGAAYGLGISLEHVKHGLEKMKAIPGRYEAVHCHDKQDFTIVVDYAHTPKALEALCSFYRDLTQGKLIVVFGSTGGGRDKAKRPVMGEVVSRYADILVVTDDDPYTEDRQGIIDQVAAGVKNKKEGESFFRILGRREGIQKALSLAGKGDTVLIAGKGSEKIWIVGHKKLLWDDKQVACEIIQQLPQV